MEHLVSLRTLLYHAIQAAERGGQQITTVNDSGNLGTRSKSICFNPVTLGDIRSHVAIKGTLTHAFPHVRLISEEDELRLDDGSIDFDGAPDEVPDEFVRAVPTDDVVDSSDITLWIDPLDGTLEFTEGLCDFVTTMVGIAVKGIPVAGVIHCPFPRPVTYWAWKGHAKCSLLENLSSTKVAENCASSLRIAVSKNPYNAGAVQQFANLAFGKQRFELVPMGGAGYKIIQVLLGNVDGYLHITRNIKKWDICAGHGLVNGLNGQITGLGGQKIWYGVPADMKRDVAVRSGFICSITRHDSLLAGCRRAEKGFS